MHSRLFNAILVLFLCICACDCATSQDCTGNTSEVTSKTPLNGNDARLDLFKGPFSVLKFTLTTDSDVFTTYYITSGKNAIQVTKDNQSATYRFTNQVIVFSVGKKADGVDSSIVIGDQGILRQDDNNGYTDFKVMGNTKMIGNYDLADAVKRIYGVSIHTIKPDFEITKKAHVNE